MVRLFVKYFISMLAAVILGFTGVHYALYKTLPWQREARVTLGVTIRGSQGQAVPDAELFLYAPKKIFIGKTNARGEFHAEIPVKRGIVAVLEAQGPTYRIRKDLPIPRMARFKVDVRLDPREAKLGHMTLISKTLEEMSQNIGKPKRSVDGPRPVTARPMAALPPTAAPLGGATPLPGAATGGLAKKDEAGAARETFPKAKLGGVSIEVSNETPRAEHRMEEALELITEAERELDAALRARGIAALRLRPLVASPDLYFEIVAHDAASQIKSSVLFKAGFDSVAARRVVGSLLRTPAEPSGWGRLVVHTTRPGRARAYVNGLPLAAERFSDRVEFLFPEAKGNATHVALAATADERPLVRKVALKEVLGRTVEWTLPEPSLSRR